MVGVTVLLWFTVAALAELKEENLDWGQACEGTNLKIVSDGGIIRGITASAIHNAYWVHWAVHYVDGKPISAEYRKARREKIHEGDHAGEFTGKDTLLVVKTWVASDGGFRIKDKELAAELAGILELATTKHSLHRRMKSIDQSFIAFWHAQGLLVPHTLSLLESCEAHARQESGKELNGFCRDRVVNVRRVRRDFLRTRTGSA